MADDELIPLPDETPPEETPDESTEEPGEPEAREDGSFVYPDGYRIDADGKHYSADGTYIPDEGETPEEKPEPEKPAAAVATPAPKPKPEAAPQPGAPGQRHIYTFDNCFSEQEQAQLQTWDVADQAKAQQARFMRFEQVKAHANDVFDSELDAYSTEAPDVVQQYGRQIDRARRSLSVEQLQTPGVVRMLAARIVADAIASDPKRLNDLVVGRAALPGQAPAEKPAEKPPEKPAPRIQPPAERMPKAHGARRRVPNRQGGGERSGAKLLQELYPGMSDAEAREFADGVRRSEERAHS